MTRRIALAAALAAALAWGTAASAQPPTPEPPASPTQPSAPQQPETPPPPPPPPLPPPPFGPPVSDESVSLSVEVTISRYRGDELVGSLPYVLALTARPDEPLPRPDRYPIHLRMNAEVPVQSRPGVPFNYRPVGTMIECHAAIVDDDRYLVTVRIEEESVYGEDALAMEAARATGAPVFRSFESNNSLLLRDGQASRYTAAADPVTGESIRVDVALTVLD